MADRTLKVNPPSEDYEFSGRYHCIYHQGFCHNPLDCDLIPTYRLKRNVALAHMKNTENLDPENTRPSHFRARKETA